MGASEPSRPRSKLEGAWASAGFAARTTAAAQLALLAAWALGLQHTHWAAMTVWLIAQPTRGLLFEKSVLRVVGTFTGAGAGLALSTMFGDRPGALVAGLAVWTGLCAGASALVRPARGYGFALAGYTAVLLMLPSQPGASTETMLVDRLLCTLLGVLCSTVVTALFTPRARQDDLDARLRRLARDVFDFASAAGIADSTAGGHARQRGLVAEIGRIGALTDQVISGFVTTHGRRRRVRRTLRALLLLLVDSRLAGERPAATDARARTRAEPEHDPVPSSLTGDALLGSIRRTAAAWPERPHPDPERFAPPDLEPAFAGQGAPGSRSRANLRDAAVSMAKTLLGIALVSAVWWATGWRHGATMLVSAAVFLTLFSANEDARTAVLHIFLGSAGGALAAILYAHLLASTTKPADTVALALPFLLVGAFAMARPLTAKAAIDFNMVFLIASPAAFSLHGDLAETAGRGLASAAGVLAATLFFHATHRSPTERVARHARALPRDLGKLAASGSAGAARLRRIALEDRVVRMAMAAVLDDRATPEVDSAVRLLGLGRAIERLVPARRVSNAVGGRPVAMALERLRSDLHRPSDCAAALEVAAESLVDAPADAPQRSDAVRDLRDAARVLRRESAFLER